MTIENNKCQNAEPFFYEYFHGSTETLPDEVLKHIENCSSCLNSIASMKDVFEQSDDAMPANSKHAVIADKLSRHFSFIDKQVACSSVKPFMAEIADPAMRITVSTPIMVHVQNCDKCAQDIQAIESLHLQSEALGNAGCFLSQKPFDNSGDIPMDLLDGILTRPDSKIVTIFSIDKSVDIAKLVTEKQQTGKPTITVQVLQEESQISSRMEQMPQKRKRTIPFLRTGIAAAIVLFVFMLFPEVAPSIDVSLGQMYQALNKMKDFHATAISPETGNVIHEKWVANSLGLMLTEQQGHSVLLDINAATMKTNGLPAEQLNKEALTDIKKTMEPSTYLLPFPYLSQALEQADWKKIEPAQGGVEMLGTEIYDLIWTDDADLGQKITNRSRCYIDTQLRVPRRTELWQKKDGQFKLYSIVEINYPEPSEIDRMIKAKGF